MQIFLSIILVTLLGLALGDAGLDSKSLDDFLRDLPPSGFNFSQSLSDLTSVINITSQPQQGWYDDKAPPPASDELWCRAVAKGTTLLNAMSYSDSDAGQTFSPPRPSARSLWSLDHLKPWGWNVYPETDEDWCEWDADGYWGFANFFRTLGISDKCVTDGGLWKVSLITHGEDIDDVGIHLDDQKYRGPDGVERRVTGSDLYMGVNGENGGAIALSRHSCADRAKELDPPVPADQFPALKSSSDLLWALWEKDVLPKDKSNINFFMSLSVENDDTLKILKRALNQIGTDLSRGGRIFDMTSEEGKAILGSPNAIAFAYFLIQHKAELGNKIIDAVHAMQCENQSKAPCLFFSVKWYHTPRKPPALAGSRQLGSVMAEVVNDFTPPKQKRNHIREHKVSIGANSTKIT